MAELFGRGLGGPPGAPAANSDHHNICITPIEPLRSESGRYRTCCRNSSAIAATVKCSQFGLLMQRFWINLDLQLDVNFSRITVECGAPDSIHAGVQDRNMAVTREPNATLGAAGRNRTENLFSSERTPYAALSFPS